MRKSQMILIGLFLAGILLGGIGTGMAIVEYSSFSYGGEKRIGQESLVTEELEFQLPQGEDVVVLSNYYYGGWDRPWQLLEDETVPEGVIRYAVTYNEDQLHPSLRFVEEEEEELDEETLSEEESLEPEETTEPQEEDPKQCGTLYLDREYRGNDFALFMKYKDQILEGLKNKTVSSYRVEHITEVKVSVNPRTAERIETQW